MAEGRASGFEYAWQFFQLPYGLIAVAVMTAFMPELSSLASRGDRRGYRLRLGQGYRLAMLVIIPVTVTYVALATPAIRLFLNQLLGTVIDSAFDERSIALTSSMLTWLAIGLPFFVTFLFINAEAWQLASHLDGAGLLVAGELCRAEGEQHQ